MPQLVVFDFDGTIMDTKSAYVEMIVGSFQKYGIKLTDEEVERTLIPSIQGTIEQLLDGRDHPNNEIVQKLVNSTIDMLSSGWMDHIEQTPKVKDLLNSLFENGIKMYVVSNSHSSFVLPAIAKFGLGKYFREVITIDSGYTGKAGMLSHLAEKTSTDISEMIYVADTRMDIEIAETVGCQMILLITQSSWDFDKREDLINFAFEKQNVRIIDGIQNAKIALLSD